MRDDDHTFGLQGPPFDDEDEPAPRPSWDDEMADAQDWWDNLIEERRISNR